MPDYLHNLISVQSSGRTRSLSVVTLVRPSVSSSAEALHEADNNAAHWLQTKATKAFAK